MGRQLNRIVTTCHKGINEDAETSTLQQCADARNVWAPEGRVVQRPGYQLHTGLYSGSSLTALSDVALVKEDPIGTYDVITAGNITLNSLPAGSRFYIGFSDTPSTYNWAGLYQTVVGGNSNACQFKPEYWNGTAWKYIPIWDYFYDENGHFMSQTTWLLFGRPGDWTTTAIVDTSSSTSYTRYYVRFTLIDNAFDAATSFSMDARVHENNESGSIMAGIAQLSSEKVYFYGYRRPGLDSTQIRKYNKWQMGDIAPVSNFSLVLEDAVIPSYGVVSVFDEIFVGFGNNVFLIKPDSGLTAAVYATVEDGDFAVGPGAPYDRDVIAQNSAFPEASFVEFFNGRLWFSGIKDNPYLVQWGAISPYHKVLPSLSFENLMEDDNSSISAMSGYGEQMVVFKNDSIWLMRDQGLNEFDLRVYRPDPIVRGVGCTSNGGIQKIRGRLVFPGEDDIYIFDGTPGIQSATQGRIKDILKRIPPGRRPFASSVHWKKQKSYLLAATLDDGDYNNHVIVWNYEEDSWWLWDGINAKIFLSDEGSYDEEILYFINNNGSLFQLGISNDDFGTAITSYVTTQRLGWPDHSTKKCREVWVEGSNYMESIDCKLWPNGSRREVDADMSFVDYNETAGYKIIERRAKKIRFNENAEWFQVKLQNSTKHKPLQISRVELGYKDIGRR